MIYDILDTFNEIYKEKGDKLILDNYILKDGLYVKIYENSIEYFIYKNDKNMENKEFCFKDINGNYSIKMYEWFKERDYYSTYLNSNKAFHDKKIHNVNYLSFFAKVDSFVNEDSKKLLSNDAIKKHYKGLCDYKKFNKKEEKEILKTYDGYLKDKNRKKDIIQKYKTVKNSLTKINNRAIEKNLNYIKIFFEEDIKKYKKESEIYYSIKIFNDIKYSVKIENSVFGLSDSNMGLNQKKPFLANKTKKLPTPFMILKEDALLIKKFFDWLKYQELKDKFPLDLNKNNYKEFFINRDYKEKDLIIDFDILPIIEDKFRTPILIKNHLLIPEDSKLIETQILEKISQLENKIDDVFYNKQLKNNYFGEVFQKLDSSFANLIYITRDSMVNYFKKGDEKTFFEVVKKYGNSFIIEHIKKNRFSKASQSLNLKLSLLEYKKEKIMDITSMKKSMLDKLLDSNYESLNKEEFFYLSGQIVKYLLIQSESYEKKGIC